MSNRTDQYRIPSDETLKPLQKVIAKCGIPLRDIIGRHITCTASRAHYGEVSHWIISVEGTPPRGTIVFDTNRYTPGAAFLLSETECLRLRGSSYKIVEDFVAKFLAAHERALVE